MKSPRRRLLCATDFSANARKAGDVAAALAARTEAELLLVHVADETNVHAGTPAEWKEFAAPSESSLRAEAARLRTAGAKVVPRVFHGQWAEQAISDEVAAEMPELVVLSAVSKSDFDRWTLGSVSERIAESLPVPTLVVRAADPFLAWGQGKRPLRVFAAFDFTTSSDAVLRWVARLGASGPCEITVGHANWPPDQLTAFGGGRQRLLRATATPPDVQRFVERDVEKRARQILPRAEFQVVVAPGWGRPDAPLIEMAENAHADLFVVGAHQWHGLSRMWHASTSRSILRHAPMSVVCVPATPARVPAPVPRFQRVLVATDFSGAGNAAIPFAMASLPTGGILRLVHVVPPWNNAAPPLAENGVARMSRAEYDRFVAESRRKLQALLPAEDRPGDLAAECEVIAHVNPATAIAQEAARFGADVVALASRGRPGLVRALLGSVVQEVMAHCTQPVLVVRPPPD